VKLPIPSHTYSASSPARAIKERPHFALAALTTFLLIAGIISPPDSALAAPPARKIELHLWHAWTAERREILNSIVKEFNCQNEDIKVVAEPFGPSGGSVAERIMLGGADGVLPGLALIERESIPLLADTSLIRPIDKLACPAEEVQGRLCPENLLDPALTYAAYEGKLYGIPAYLNPFVLIFNPDALSGMDGISGPPSDWQTLFTVAEALDKEAATGSRRWTLGIRSMAPLFHILCLQRGIDFYGAGSGGRQASALREVLDFLHALRRERSLLPPRRKFWDPHFAGVANRKTLFQIDSATMLSYLRKESPAPLAAATVPSDALLARTVLSNSPVFVVTAAAIEDGTALEFLEFFFSPEHYSPFAKKLSVVSPLKNADRIVAETASEMPSYPQIVAAAMNAAAYPIERRSGTLMPRIARIIERLDAGLIGPGPAHAEIMEAIEEAEGAPPALPRASVKVSWAESTRRLFSNGADGSRPAPIRIVSGQNEHEAFQLVLSASSELDGLTLGFAPFVSEDRGPQTIEMSAYLVADTFIPRPMVSQKAGPHPNILEPCDAFGVSPGRLTRIWVDVFVAHDVPPGEYSSSAEIRSGGSVVARAPIRLRVLPLKLPATPSQPAVVGLNYELIAGRYGLRRGTDERREVMDSFYWFMVDRRLSPFQPPVPIDSPELAAYLEDERVSACRIPLNPSDRRFHKTVALAEKGGWLQKMFVYYIDEPMYHLYKDIIESGDRIHAMPASPRFLVTCFPDESLIGSVDIWCIHLGFIPVGIPAGHMERRMFADSVHRRITAGDEVWWYTAGAVGPFPTLHIEDDPAAFRVIPWLQQLHRIGGFLHWEAANWSGAGEDDPFVKFFGNGEGVLVYPGDLRPLSSIRLELLRAGLEDMEILLMLRRGIEDLQRKLEAERLGEVASIRVEEMCRRLIRDDALRASGSGGLLLTPHFLREPGAVERVREEVAEEAVALGERPHALVLTEPEEKLYTESESVRVYGVVESGCRIEINGRRVRADRGGDFSSRFPLSSGTNDFRILLRKGKHTKIIHRKVERF